MLGTYTDLVTGGNQPSSVHRYFFRPGGEFEFWPYQAGHVSYVGMWEQVSADTVHAYVEAPSDPAANEWPWWEEGTFEVKRERECIWHYGDRFWARQVSIIDPETGERDPLDRITAGEFCARAVEGDSAENGWKFVKCGDAPTWETPTWEEEACE